MGLMEITPDNSESSQTARSMIVHSSNPKSRRFDDNSILRLGLFQNGPGFILERPRSNSPPS